MGRFPQVSSLGNKYIIVIHNVDSNSLWEEALKDNTGSELILARAQALEQMQKAGIVLKHQILDNQASAAYKKAISDFNMTYEVVINATWPKEPSTHSRTILSYAPLVPTSPAGRTATSSPPTITTPSQLFCLCTHLWPP
jgi:hypothetical protein